MFGAKAQPASFLGDFCNKICHKATFALQQNLLFDHLIQKLIQIVRNRNPSKNWFRYLGRYAFEQSCSLNR